MSLQRRLIPAKHGYMQRKSDGVKTTRATGPVQSPLPPFIPMRQPMLKVAQIA
jgi:hypothetical protein